MSNFKNGDKVYLNHDGSEWTITKITDYGDVGEHCWLVNNKGEKLPMYLSVLKDYGFSTSKPASNSSNRLSLIRKLQDFVAEEGYTDYDECEEIFNLMNPKNQEKFLNKHGYEDLGDAYDDNRELAFDLINELDDEELNKCYKLAKDLENAEEW